MASAGVAAAVRTAAEALRTAGERLWRAVDTKVDAVVAVQKAAPADWSAAAATVISGAGDRASAAELVDKAVKPFVDSTVRTEWLSAVHTAMAAVTDAYQRATAEIGGEAHPVFEVAGELGPAARSVDPGRRAVGRPGRRTRTDIGPAGADHAVGVGATDHDATVARHAWVAAGRWSAACGQCTGEIRRCHRCRRCRRCRLRGRWARRCPTSAAVSRDWVASSPIRSADCSAVAREPSVPTRRSCATSWATSRWTSRTTTSPMLTSPMTIRRDDDESDDEAPDDDVTEEPSGDAASDGAAAQQPDEGEVAPAPTPPPPPAEPLPPAEPPPAESVAGEQTPCEIAADEVPQVGDPPR